MGKVVKENFAGVSEVKAEGTAKYLQSFEEMAVMQEAPPKTGGYIPRSSPKTGQSGDVGKVAGVNAPGRLMSAYDGTSNLRADNQILTRATPTSDKGTRDKRPNRLRIYRDASGEELS